MTKIASFKSEPFQATDKQIVCTRIKMLFTVFKYLSFAKLTSEDVIHSTNFLIKYDKKGYLRQFDAEMFDLLQHDSTRGISPWQHTGFHTSTKLKAFLISFNVLY